MPSLPPIVAPVLALALAAAVAAAVAPAVAAQADRAQVDTAKVDTAKVDTAVGAATQDDVVVIVNRANENRVDRAFVVRVYTGAIRGWPDGTPVFALDQPEGSPARLRFVAGVLGRSPSALKAIWSQNIFTGKGYPPRLATPDEEMKRIVAGNRNAIGYIRASAVDGTVRVVRP